MPALNWLKLAVVVTGVFFAAASVQAQEVTVLRGSPPRPAAAIDCNNPDYTQYCQAYGAGSDPDYGTYDYGDSYPYYGVGVPAGIGRGSRFHHGGNSHNSFVGGGFHGGGFSGGGFHGSGFGGGHR